MRRYRDERTKTQEETIGMSAFSDATRDLVIANRILAHEGVLDAYGHVSVRHPDDPARFLLARSRSPELVERSDIMEFFLDGRVTTNDPRPPYLERFIHGSFYQARPEVNAVIHSHAESVLPYSISTVRLRPVFHAASPMGTEVPVWDIRDRFGDTNLLVQNVEQGRDLAARLASANVVLMRGHGFSAAARTLVEATRLAVYLPANARIMSEALRLGGEIKPLSEGEVALNAALDPKSPAIQRAWEYWARRAGCADMLG
jgi:ribulose-5-phosphate 4-epimerase/fuculose-1-phosphate aldolase